MSFCPKCGAQNVEGAAFCAQCGTPIQNVRPSQCGANPESASNPFQVGSQTQTVGYDITGEAPEVPNPFRAFVICMKKYADAKGRAGRAEYFGFGFVCFLIGFGIAFAVAFGVGMDGGDPEEAGQIASGILNVLFLAFIFPSWCVAIRRCHDLGYSGWLSLLNLIPLVNLIFALVLLFVSGQPFPNKYGLPPQRRR